MGNLSDVIVVGAGSTGLSAATVLRGAGLSCMVLEARDRVGGRVEARRNALGELIDTGGQFLCEDMPSVLELVRRYGKTLVEAPVAGNLVVWPPDGIGAAGEEYDERVDAIHTRFRSADLSNDTFSGMTAADWIAIQPDGQLEKAGFRSMMEGIWCRSLEEIPLWHLLECERRITNSASELQYFVGETMYSLAADMSEELGDAVQLAMPVDTVRHTAGKVEVSTAGRTFTARRLIVALPPSRAAGLAFSPALPAPLNMALGAWKPGTVIKILLRYETAFWRDSGSSGTVMWHDPAGLYVCDASHSDKEPGIVMFVGGPLAVEWQTGGEDAIRERALSALAEALGAKASHPLDISLRNWTDDTWSGGAYSDLIVDMDACQAERLLLEGHGSVIFAASELSPSFPGYIEGAIVAGRIAAEKAAVSLNDQSRIATSASGS